MIALPAGVKVWLAAGATDMRKYAEPGIMRSCSQGRLDNCGIFGHKHRADWASTQHKCRLPLIAISARNGAFDGST